jgi:hypothetical protein
MAPRAEERRRGRRSRRRYTTVTPRTGRKTGGRGGTCCRSGHSEPHGVVGENEMTRGPTGLLPLSALVLMMSLRQPSPTPAQTSSGDVPRQKGHPFSAREVQLRFVYSPYADYLFYLLYRNVNEFHSVWMLGASPFTSLEAATIAQPGCTRGCSRSRTSHGSSDTKEHICLSTNTSVLTGQSIHWLRRQSPRSRGQVAMRMTLKKHYVCSCR